MFYLDLFRALDHHRVEYALIGGLADVRVGLAPLAPQIERAFGWSRI